MANAKSVPHSVLVTGANGFVGKALCELLVGRDMHVSAVVRNSVAVQDARFDYISVGDIDGNTDWHTVSMHSLQGRRAVLENIDCVVHLAARVHVMNETASNPLDEFRRVNTYGTEKLARDAASAGVKRFIYVSTIKVNGEETVDLPFTEQVNRAPVDPYGLSKWEAENILRQISLETGMEVVIIRPPLVYGPGVKGNFLTLLKLVSKGLPLPFARVTNKRSLVALDNLVDLIRECIVNPAASGETFLVSDGEDLSTADLVVAIAHGMKKSPRLIPVPVWLINIGASLVGKQEMANRLLGSLQVDSSKAYRLLGWRPPQTVGQEIERVVHWHNMET